MPVNHPLCDQECAEQKDGVERFILRMSTGIRVREVSGKEEANAVIFDVEPIYEWLKDHLAEIDISAHTHDNNEPSIEVVRVPPAIESANTLCELVRALSDYIMAFINGYGDLMMCCQDNECLDPCLAVFLRMLGKTCPDLGGGGGQIWCPYDPPGPEMTTPEECALRAGGE